MLIRSQTLTELKKNDCRVSDKVISGFLGFVLFHPGLLLCLKYCTKTLLMVMI